MKYLIIIVFTICFSFSCAPSLHQLEHFELAQNLERGYLLVTLENHSEEILLLKKYGQHKKAERLAKKDANYNTNIKQAISESYNYSNVIFTYSNKYSKAIEYETLIGEKINLTSDVHLFNLHFEKKRVNQNESEEESLSLKLIPNQNSYLNNSELIVEANVNENLQGYRLLLEKMNKKLIRLSNKADENLFNKL